MPPLVSVVIPCYAQGHFLGEAVQSVLAQVYPMVELIVVNDGSPDTPVLEAALAPFRDRLTYIVRANGGIAAARNSGLARATGEYLIFLDADDRLLVNAVSDGAAALSADPARGLVWGLRHLMDGSGVVFRQDTGRMGAGERYPDLLRTNIIGPPSGTMWRRSVLASIGGFSSVLTRAEDYDAYLRVAQRHRVHCHGATVLEYRVHAAGMSGNHRMMYRGVQEVLDGQLTWVAGDAELQRAVRVGRRDARDRYLWIPRLDRVREYARLGKWSRAMAGGLLLMAQHPRRFSPVLARQALSYFKRDGVVSIGAGT